MKDQRLSPPDRRAATFADYHFRSRPRESSHRNMRGKPRPRVSFSVQSKAARLYLDGLTVDALPL